MISPKTEKTFRIVSIALMLVTAIGALPAGFSYIVDPSGAGLGATPEVLRYSPFSDFFIPGLVLFTFNGIFNLVSAVISIARVRYYGYFIFGQGSILFGWIAIQVGMLRVFNWYHAVFGLIGIALIVMGWLIMRRKQ